jgi:uncharacterized protein YqeY
MQLKSRITEDMKTAMRAKDTARLGAIRLLLAAVKQREVDERIELDDAQIITAIDKMLKQRRDSIAQFEAAGRLELAEIEKFEIGVLQDYMPQAASADEIDALIEQAINASAATDIKDMGKVMTIVKAQLTGRADMAQVSTRIKSRLA